MSLADEYAAHGIDPTDPVYDAELHSRNIGPRCLCCQHAEANRRARCDLEAARAARMNDPLYCFTCSRVFERGSVTNPETLGESLIGCCGECQSKRPKSVKGRRAGLSSARARKVRHSDPWRELSSYTNDELFYEAYDEVPS